MISPINIIIASLWFLSAVVDYLDFCYLWQLKEYRLDRFRDFLSTQQGKVFFLKYSLFWRSSLAIIIFFWPINDIPTIKYLLLGIFSLDFLYNLYKFLYHRLSHPVLTAKAILIVFIALVFEGGLFVFTKEWTLPLMLLILRFFILAFIVFLVNKLTDLVKHWIIKKATKKISHYPNLIVIGITGSYGKTTTKTFLHHILQGKFKTVMTPKHVNTEIGVAKFILRADFSHAEIFIVEMGAYCIGEIKRICNIVHPKIGILTAINEQHLSLFGNIKKTQETKYELLRSLPPDGLAVTNADNQLCMEFVNELKSPVWTFGAKEENKPDFLIKDVKRTDQGIHCVGYMDGELGQVDVPIIGEHNFMNIAPCFLIGKFLGMTRQQVRERCLTLKLPEGSLQIYEYGQAKVLDDSYNSNPNGFLAVLDVLKTFPSEYRRVIVTRGMLELGEKSFEIHRSIGEEISLVAEELIIINKDQALALAEGVGDRFNTKVNFIFENRELLNYLKSLKNTKTVILLENRLPENVYYELTGKKSVV